MRSLTVWSSCGKKGASDIKDTQNNTKKNTWLVVDLLNKFLSLLNLRSFLSTTAAVTSFRPQWWAWCTNRWRRLREFSHREGQLHSGDSQGPWPWWHKACIPLVHPILKSMLASHTFAQLTLWATTATNGAFALHLSTIHTYTQIP